MGPRAAHFSRYNFLWKSTKKVEKPRKRKHLDIVRASGKAGSSRRVIIPQQIFQELDWNKGDKIVIRRSGKNKIVIEKSAG